MNNKKIYLCLFVTLFFILKMSKTNKLTAKEKKELKKKQLKEENEKIKIMNQKIKEPYLVEDLMSTLIPFRNYTRNGLSLQLKIIHAQKASADDFKFCFDLVKTNMEDLYENSWGWSDSSKKAEMKEDDSLFLIAYDQENPVGFCSFRFEFDNEKQSPVLYLYEIQLDDKVKRKGLGKWMMQILELLAIKYGMDYVMLTVFKENDSGLSFYHSLKYGVDEISPSRVNPLEEEESYEILSKCFKR